MKIAIHDPAISFLDTYWKKTKTIIIKHIHNPIPNVHSSITFNIQNTEVTYISNNWWMKKEVAYDWILRACIFAQLHPNLWDPMDCSLPSSSVHGISQAKILEWVAISSFRGSSPPRDQPRVSYISCIGRRILYPEPSGKPTSKYVLRHLF